MIKKVYREKMVEAFQRAAAAPIRVSDILQGSFLQENESQPPSLRLLSRQVVFRVNLLATVLYKEAAGMITTLVVDDGSGQIPLRCFEEKQNMKRISVGSTILIIGKVRSFSGETYVSPEIVTSVAPLWLKVRAKLLEKQAPPASENIDKESPPEQNREGTTAEEDILLLPTEKITKLIQDLDKGGGASIEEVIEKSPIEGTEQLLGRMQERGDIFQIAPGKIKVL